MDLFFLEDNHPTFQTIYDGKIGFRILLGIFVGNELTVKGRNIPAYDTAHRGMAGAVLPTNLSPLITFHNNAFCIAPTTTALGIDTYDFFMDLSNNNAIVNSSSTHIDGYAASDRESEQYGINQDHGSLDNKIGITLLNGLIPKNGIGGIPIDPTSGASILDNRTFNTGINLAFQQAQGVTTFPKLSIENALEIINGGKYWINRINLVGFIDVPESPMNSFDTHTDVFIKSKSCAESMLLINVDNGEFRIGDWTGASGNTANVYVQENATIQIKSGGELIVQDNSQLIIQKDGEVIIGGLIMLETRQLFIIN